MEPSPTTSLQRLQGSSQDVREKFGRIETCKRDLWHQKQRLLPPEPAQVADLVIPDDWKTTEVAHAQRFLLHDNEGGQQRMLIFATDEQLRALANATVWHMDRTFSCCPRLFLQLYTIRVPLESSVTCVYAFLPNKRQATYEAFLQAITEECLNRNIPVVPSRVVTDFETAVINAVTSVLGQQVR